MLSRSLQPRHNFITGNNITRNRRTILVCPFLHHLRVGKSLQRIEMRFQADPVFGRKPRRFIFEFLKAH